MAGSWPLTFCFPTGKEKQMKKRIIAIFCAVACFLVAFVPVFAKDESSQASQTAKDCSIQINDPVAGQTYTAYQIFSGQPYRQSDGNILLDNLNWGSSITTLPSSSTGSHGINLTNYGISTPALADTQSAREIARELTGKSDTDMQKAARGLLSLVNPHAPAGQAKAQSGSGSQAAYVISGLAPGYYLVTDTVPKGVDSPTSAILLEVLDATVSVEPKKGAPTLKKWIKTNPESEYNSASPDWTTQADFGKNDVINYKLEATLPSQMEYYSAYQMTLTDQIENGLILNQDSIVLTVVTDSGNKTVPKSEYSVESKDGNFTVTIPNAKVLTTDKGEPAFLNPDARLEITYYCQMDPKQALIFSSPNENTATLTYSDSPEDSSKTSTTKQVTATFYTFEVKVFKEDEKKNPLAGAGFTLYKLTSNGKQEFETIGPNGKTAASGPNQNEFDFTDLGSGRYQLAETTTPDGYSTMAPITFTLQAHYDVDDAGQASKPSVTIDGVNAKTETPGVFQITIQNQSGLHLPDTGSAGLAILLVAGAAALIAGIVLGRKNKAAKD